MDLTGIIVLVFLAYLYFNGGHKQKQINVEHKQAIDNLIHVYRQVMERHAKEDLEVFKAEMEGNHAGSKTKDIR